MFSIAWLEKLIWVLVFVGIAVFGLGIAVGRSDDALGYGLMAGGALLALVGALFVWVRSRMAP